MTSKKKLSSSPAETITRSAVGAVMMLFIASSAQAGVTNSVAATVQPVTSQVSYSTAANIDPTASPPLKGQTFVAYDVTVTNVSGNAVNNIQFVGALYIRNNQSLETNSSESADLALGPVYDANGAPVTTCSKLASAPSSLTPTPPTGALIVSCSIGKLTAGSSRTLKLFFLAPPNRTGITDASQFREVARFYGVNSYSEGTSDTSTVPNDVTLWSAAWSIPTDNDQALCLYGENGDVCLGTTNPTYVKSALSKNGGTFLTGTNAYPGSVASGLYPFASSVSAPKSTNVNTTVEILLSPITPDPLASSGTTARECSVNDKLLTCYASALTIPSLDLTNVTVGGTQQYLTIVLRIAPTELKQGTKIDKVRVFYSDSTDPNQKGDEVVDCKNVSPNPGIAAPCWTSRQAYKNNASPAELRGVFEWIIIYVKNGGYKVL